MQRIIYRALAMLICALMLISIVGAGSLNTQPHRSDVADELATTDQSSMFIAPTLSPATLVPTQTSLMLQADEDAARAFALLARGGDAIAPFVAPTLEPVSRPVPQWIDGDGPWMRGTLVQQTQRLDLYVGPNTFSADQIAERAAKFERVLRAAEEYFGVELDHRVSIGFYSTPPKRGVRGMAYTSDGRVELYYRSGEDMGRATTILMHELGHHLEAQRYGETAQRRADTILHEGLATWIASIRWLDQCGASSWRERGRQLRDSGVPLRLLTAERSGSDNAYELWASFVDYLIRQYGWKKFNALYASGQGRAPGSAQYQSVLGKTLEELSDDWRAWLAN